MKSIIKKLYLVCLSFLITILLYTYCIYAESETQAMERFKDYRRLYGDVGGCMAAANMKDYIKQGYEDVINFSEKKLEKLPKFLQKKVIDEVYNIETIRWLIHNGMQISRMNGFIDCKHNVVAFLMN